MVLFHDAFHVMVLKAGNLEFMREQLFGMKIGTSSKMKVCPNFPSTDFLVLTPHDLFDLTCRCTVIEHKLNVKILVYSY